MKKLCTHFKVMSQLQKHKTLCSLNRLHIYIFKFRKILMQKKKKKEDNNFYNFFQTIRVYSSFLNNY